MLKTYLVILTLSNGAEVVEPASFADCQYVFRQLRYYDAMGIRMQAQHKSGVTGPVVAFECRPAETADGTPTS